MSAKKEVKKKEKIPVPKKLNWMERTFGMGNRQIYKEPMKLFSIRLPNETAEGIKKLSNDNSLSHGILELVEKYNKK